MLTTLNSYGNIPCERQAEIFDRLRSDLANPDGGPDSETIRRVVAHLVQRAG